MSAPTATITRFGTGTNSDSIDSSTHDEIKHDPSLLPPCKSPEYIKNSVTKLICQRHSTRSFLPDPVPTHVLEDVLSLAQHAPSNSNIQPWRVHVLSGDSLHRLSSRLVDKVVRGEKPVTAPLPEEYRKYRSDLGHQLYGPEGYDVPRSDKEATQKAQLRNYQFFGAPVAAIVCMDKKLEDIDALSIGMYLQTVCLLLAERGLGTCVAVSVVSALYVWSNRNIEVNA